MMMLPCREVLGLGEALGPGDLPHQTFRTAPVPSAASNFSCNLGTGGPSSWAPPWRLVKRDG